MEANEKDQKIKDLTDKVEFLSTIIIKAHKYAKNDPEVALTQARKSAEAICRNIFSAEIGEPGKIMLDELIKKLAERKLLPTKILLPLGTIQAYGNYGTHAQSSNETIDFNYITPCLSALAQVSSWYFTEYLKTTLPPGLYDETADHPAAEPAAQAPSAPRAGGPSAVVTGSVGTTGDSALPSDGKKKSRGLVIGLFVVALAAVAAIIYFRTRTAEGQAVPEKVQALAETTAVASQPGPTAHETTMAVTEPALHAATRKEEPAKETPAQPKAGGAHAATTSPSSTSSGGKPETTPATSVPVSTVTSDATILKQVAPRDPNSLKGSGITGDVRLRIQVDSTGAPSEVRILDYDQEKFKQPAIDAARSYRFNPALSSGKKVASWVVVKMTFKEE